MRGWLCTRAEIVDRAHQSLSKVMLPDAVDDHARNQRACAIIQIGHPFGHGSPLLGRIRAPTLSLCGAPILIGRFAPGKNAEEAKLHRLAFGAKIAARQQKAFTRLWAEISKAKRGGQWFGFPS